MRSPFFSQLASHKKYRVTRYPKKAMTWREGDHRAGEPKQSPTPGSFAGLENREEVIAKPRTPGAFPHRIKSGEGDSPPCHRATSLPFTTGSTKSISRYGCTRAPSPRCNSESTSSRPPSVNSGSRNSGTRPVTCYVEIRRRKCRRCGKFTRDLRAVFTAAGWRELCFWCRQPFLWEAAGRERP